MSEVQGSWMQYLISSIRREVEEKGADPGEMEPALEPGTWRCMVCARPHNSLLVLPCQHKFCERCLSLWVGIYIDMYRGHTGEFPCQVCWATYPVPAQGFSVYAQDYQVRMLQESLGNISMDTGPAVSMETAQQQEERPPRGGDDGMETVAMQQDAGERDTPAEALTTSLPTPGTNLMCNPGYCYKGYKAQACQYPHHLM